MGRDGEAGESSEMDGPFVTSGRSGAKGEPRVRSSASRWSDPAPTSGVWDPRGPTPQERRRAYDRQLGWGRWFGGAFFVLGVIRVALSVAQIRDGQSRAYGDLVLGLLMVDVGMAGVVVGLGVRGILGDDPEEPFDDVAARGRRYHRRAVHPALAVTNLVLAAVLLAALPGSWPVAVALLVVGLGFGMSWRRTRSGGSVSD